MNKNIPQFILISIFSLVSLTSHSAVFDINTPAYISCVTDETVELIKIGEYEGNNQGDKLRSVFFKWVFDKVEKELKAQIDFVWKPKTKEGPQIEVITRDETYHTFVSVRSKTKNSIIVVSSASRIHTVISWLFTFNFNLKTMLASRVQSGVANVRGEVMTFDCKFESIMGQGNTGSLLPIDAEIELLAPEVPSSPGEAAIITKTE